jgi:hypothetical protein
MFAQKALFSRLGRVAIAGVAAITLTAVEPAVAAPAGKVTTVTGTSGATDFSAQRRYYRRGGGAAAAAAFAGIVGTGLAIAASRPYYDSYGYYGGPTVVYESPGYGYYGGPGYYGYGGYYPNGGRYVGGYNTGQYW